MPDSNAAPVTVSQIEAIVSTCYAFAGLERASTSDLDLWGSFFADDERVTEYYIRNNAQRILDILQVLLNWERMKSAGGNSPGLKLLEVGLGYGEVALSIAKAFPAFAVHGIEHPNRGFLMADSYLSAMKESGVTILGADLGDKRLPLADASFDVVLFCEVLEHLSPVRVPAAIAELARVTRPGGAVVMASPNLVSLYNRLVFGSGASVFTPAIPLDYAGGTFGHIREYTVPELANLAQRAGLALKHVRYSNAMLMGGTETKLHSILVKRVQMVASRLLPSLANGWTVLLVKDE